MKIMKLHIYGFGRFQDYHIDFTPDGINLIFGENEAGKSTIMAFIRYILFGFPTKQSQELRYEPRLGGRYGGSIVIESTQYGTVTIERTKGKATGDVKLYLEDGTIGNEVELHLVLGEIDRTIYSGIYSFGLSDLQALEHLHSDELNKFLYGVGIAGRNNLLEIEKKNDKMMQALYKPAGKKPAINDQLNKVMKADELTASWRKKRNQYEQLVNDRLSIVENLELVGEEHANLNSRYRYLEKLQSMAPVVHKKKMYEIRLEQLPTYVPFPEDGLHRFELLKDKCVDAEGQMNEYSKKLEAIRNDKQRLTVDGNLIELDQLIGEIRESRKIYESKRDELTILFQQKQFEQQEYLIILDKLGSDDPQYETGYEAEEKLTFLIEQEAKLKQQQFVLQSQYEQARKKLEEKERHVKELEIQLLDEKTRVELEAKVATIGSETELRQQLVFIKDSLQRLEKQRSFAQKEKNARLTSFYIVGILIGIFGAFSLILNDQTFIAAVLLVAAFSSLVFLRMFTKNRLTGLLKNLKDEKADLELQKQKIEEKLNIGKDSSYEREQRLLIQDQHKREQLQFLIQTLTEANSQFEYSCSELDKWEYGMNIFREELTYWAKQYRYPGDFDALQYQKLLKMMEDAKKKKRQVTFLDEKLAVLEKDIGRLENKVQELCQKLSIPYVLENFQQNVENLTEHLRKEQEKDKLLQKIAAQESQLEEAMLAVQERMNQYQKEIEKLWKMASVDTEEEYRQKGKAWVESEEIKAQLRVYKSQIIPVLTDEITLEKLECDVLHEQDTLREQMAEIEKKLSDLRSKEKHWLERTAKLDLEISEVEDGSNYSRSLHNLENEKGILNAEVRKWALHRTVQLLIDEAKKVYEKKRQPQVIKEATRMFTFLTNGEYIRLSAPIGEQKLIVERQDGLKFEPNELSQGTKEQLYLALRFALAKVHSKQTSFPIVMDDILVNFDQGRRQKAVELIKKMSKEHQIIFFTCHPFMAKEISEQHFLLKEKETAVEYFSFTEKV